jgi:hypothetical protein
VSFRWPGRVRACPGVIGLLGRGIANPYFRRDFDYHIPIYEIPNHGFHIRNFPLSQVKDLSVLEASKR